MTTAQEPLFLTTFNHTPGFVTAPPEELSGVVPLVVNLNDRPVPAFDVYIGRDFRGYADQGFGNPLHLKKESLLARAEILVAYWGWLNCDVPKAASVRRRVRSGELGGKVLGCWCAGKGLCHGHVLAGLALGRVEAVRLWVADLSRWSVEHQP
jgi:hypothetical protein